MNNLTLRDPTIYGFTEDDTPRFTEPGDILCAFLSGDHAFQPFAEPPPNEHQATHTSEFLTGNHFDALITREVQLDGSLDCTFLSGRHFLALPSTTSLLDQGAGQTAEFLSGNHLLTLIIDPQFEPGSAPSDDVTGTAEFLEGEHREIQLANDADEDFATHAAEFLSGSYDMVLPGTGLEDNEAIIRFTASNNSSVLTVTYGTIDFVSEATFDQPFVYQPSINYQITSDLGSTLTTDQPFLGGAVDQLYALIFTLAFPENVRIPGGINRGGATGSDADRSNVTCEFLDGEHFEKLIIAPTVDEDFGSATAEFLDGVHLAVLVTFSVSDNGTATAEFLSGDHEEIILIVDEDAENSTITATFLTGVHEYPGGAHPFADSAATVDTTAFQADNGKLTFDDNLASPSMDNTLYTMDEEY